MLQEIRSSRASMFCKNGFVKLHNFHRKASVMKSLLEKLWAHTSATALKSLCFVSRLNTFFFGSFHSNIGSDVFYKKYHFWKKNWKTYKKTPLPEFLSDKVVHHQACNFIEKRLQLRCFTVNFAKKAPSLQNSFGELFSFQFNLLHP